VLTQVDECASAIYALKEKGVHIDINLVVNDVFATNGGAMRGLTLPGWRSGRPATVPGSHAVKKQWWCQSKKGWQVDNMKKILVADDDARNRVLLETLLTADGYHVVTVGSGQAALESVAASPPDLILLDLMMPGMDGFEVVRRLKAAHGLREIPVVMVTALDDSGSRARLQSAGVADFLTKPIDRWKLRESLTQLLGEDDARGRA